MVLPNAQKRMFVTDWDINPAGVAVSPNPGNLVTLKTDNLPRHGHSPRTEYAGRTNPRVTISPSWRPLTRHQWRWRPQPRSERPRSPAQRAWTSWATRRSIISLMWGGKNKIDALFNDRNHTYSVEAFDWTKPALTGISISAAGSEHSHYVQPAEATTITRRRWTPSAITSTS